MENLVLEEKFPDVLIPAKIFAYKKKLIYLDSV